MPLVAIMLAIVKYQHLFLFFVTNCITKTKPNSTAYIKSKNILPKELYPHIFAHLFRDKFDDLLIAHIEHIEIFVIYLTQPKGI